jgi:radical SAM enzyme (TIGR01210 family)
MTHEIRVAAKQPFFHGFDFSYPWGDEFIIELATPTCPYRCTFCAIHIPNIGKQEADQLSTDILPQIQFSIDYLKNFRTRNVFRINLSIAGSVLDPNSVDPQSLLKAIDHIGEHSDIKWLNFETRAELLTADRYDEICDHAEAGGMRVIPGIGYETRSAYIRNEVLHKYLSDEAFEQMVHITSKRHRALKPLCLIKPWEAPQEEYKREAYETVAYLARLQAETGVMMEVHVAPTYVAPETPLYAAFKRNKYGVIPERHFLEILQSFRDLNIRVWVCYHSETRAVPGGDLLQTCARPDIYAALIQEFNINNDYNIIDSYLDMLSALEH